MAGVLGAGAGAEAVAESGAWLVNNLNVIVNIRNDI